MNKVMGIINLAGEKDSLAELTKERCLAAVPFAARYRLIDFSLTNMVRSHINEIAIFARNNYRSLLTHVGSGADWELNKRHGGLYVLPPYWKEKDTLGDVDYFLHNWDYIERSQADHILISGSSFIANTDYHKLIEQHIEQDADITLLSTYAPSAAHSEIQRLAIQVHDKFVSNIAVNISDAPIFTGVYIIKKSCLNHLVHYRSSDERSNHLIEMICDNLKTLKVCTFAHREYGSFITSLEEYFRENIRLLDPQHYLKLFQQGKNVSTKISNYRPTKYESTANVKQSIISTGCRIAGNVERSMLSRAVTVKEGSTIKNSIILDHCTIESGAYIENAIIDKYTVLTEKDLIIGKIDKPHIIGKLNQVSMVTES
ncbi:glucose-1-phosphate adenylyltransferase subunit GlgD [Gracilibacillus xinjiangensis]|uniref:Glucose-1-phosphate adenylyltransferase subunit GlgD n=1 Tax=Gracilibacillus xinjiangensis TaxID=1193282 RepID=A0ABV8WX29_9BACI